MDQEAFKKASRRLVIELVVVVALVSYSVNFPKGESSAQNWQFVFTHPLVLLHVVVGTIILVEALVLLIRSLRSGNRWWVVLALIGLALVLLAYASGVSYAATPTNTAISYMGDSWFGAIVTYGFGWYWGRKKAGELTRQKRA